MKRLTTLEQCRVILRAAGWLVPRRIRSEWRREWEAELSCAWQASRATFSPNGRSSAGLRRRCWGAFADASWHRLHHEDMHRPRGHWPRSPGFALFALASVFLLLITSSGYLPRMRSLLMPPPYADPQHMATISGTGIINSAEWMVPYSWVSIWKRPNPAFEGVAAYSAQPHPSILTVAGRSRNIDTVQVEANLLQLFGVKPLLGQSLPTGACHACLLLTYQAWQQNFDADANLIGKRVTIDRHQAVILGVLPERFWFPSEDVGVLQIGDETSFSGNKPVGVVARLRPGVTERAATWELQRSIANGMGESFGNSSIQVWSLQERVRQPLLSYVLALGITLLLMTAILSTGRLNLVPKGGVASAWRWWTFFAAKTSLLLLMLLAIVVEFTPEPYIFPRGRATLILESGSLWIFSVGCMFVLWWSLMDQQGRCRACLHKLALPAQIGPSGCMLLSWAGTELVCAQGHGLLHVTETDICWLDPTQWTQLDESWELLFAEDSSGVLS